MHMEQESERVMMWPKHNSDQEQSGDELAPSSYLAGSGAFDVAEQWISEDEVDELDEDNPPLQYFTLPHLFQAELLESRWNPGGW